LFSIYRSVMVPSNWFFHSNKMRFFAYGNRTTGPAAISPRDLTIPTPSRVRLAYNHVVSNDVHIRRFKALKNARIPLFDTGSELLAVYGTHWILRPKCALRNQARYIDRGLAAGVEGNKVRLSATGAVAATMEKKDLIGSAQ
jgi:hypothetical protein